MVFEWFFLLLLPSIVVRTFSLKHKGVRGWGYGVATDVFVHAQLLLLFLPLMKAAWIPGLFYFALQLDIFFDAFLYRSTAIRMDVAFFAFFDDIRHLWDSAKAKDLHKFLPFPLILLFYSLAVFHLTPLPLSFQPLLYVFVGSGILSLLGACFLQKNQAYGAENIVFQQEVSLIKRAATVVKRWGGDEQLADHPFTPGGEECSPLSPDYPLLKWTREFSGPKQCDVAVEVGEKPHVIFLFMESFRAKDIGALGGKYGVSPHFDALAKKGVLFTNFYGNSVKTSRSVISSLFGVPSDIDSSEGSDLPLIGLPDILLRNGYHTAYLHNGPVQFENQLEFFLSHGFKEVIGKSELVKEYPDAPVSSWGLPDEYLMDYAIDYLKAQTEPSFLTMFTITNHHPWKVPHGHEVPDFPDVLSETYRKFLSTFHYSDHCLGAFVQRLHEEGLAENTILCVLGDHGQPMGEHDDNFIEQKGLYEENIHLPLLIYAPGRVKETVISDVASQLDLLPTVMDMLHLQGVNHAVGTSLLREVSDRTIFFHNPYVFGYYGARRGVEKVIYHRNSQEAEAYDLSLDPQERAPKSADELVPEIKQYIDFFQTMYDRALFAPERHTIRAGNVSAHELRSRVRQARYLIELDLSNCAHLTDELLLELVLMQPQLRTLSLAGCASITNSGIDEALATLTSLESVILPEGSSQKSRR